jgi:hypothetical protein
MAAPQLAPCAESLETLERVNYFPRQLLTADDMRAEQDYFRQKLRRHNRFLHGYGVACGLWVEPAPLPAAPWRVAIGEGYALGPYGDEIFVGERVYMNLAECGPGAATDPCEPAELHGRPAGARSQIFLAIRYDDCLARPVRAPGAGCGCDEMACEYSRVRDSFEIHCLDHRPDTPSLESICEILSEKRSHSCPPCPDEPWVLLARIVLPGSSKTKITANQIDNSLRPYVFSTAMLQHQIIECCCGHRDTPKAQPVRVASVSPAPGAHFDVKQVVVTFDKDVQAGTVNTSTVIVHGDGEALEGQVQYTPAQRKAVFTPSKVMRAGEYKITVKGAGSQAVRDVDDLALDGNKDGNAGDDFTSTFSILEPPA